MTDILPLIAALTAGAAIGGAAVAFFAGAAINRNREDAVTLAAHLSKVIDVAAGFTGLREPRVSEATVILRLFEKGEL